MRAFARLAIALACVPAAAAPLKIAAARGTALEAANALAARLMRDGLGEELAPIAADGDGDALAQVTGKKAELALTRSDLVADAFAGRTAQAVPELRLIAVLHPVRITLWAKRGASAAALRGKRVGLPLASSSDAASAWMPLALAGVARPADVEPTRAAPEALIAAFARGELDLVVTIARDGDPSAAKLAAAGAVPLPLPAALDPTLPDHPGFFIEQGTLSVDAVVAALADLPAPAAGAICDAAQTARLPLPAVPAKQGAARAAVPFHEGALEELDRQGALPLPLEVETGVYAYSISELDLARGTFLLDAYVWFRWRGPHLGAKPFEFTVVNGTIESQEDSPVVHQGALHRQSKRIAVRLRAHYQLHDYPFDTQILPLAIEHRWLGAGRLVFVPDAQAVPPGKAPRDAFLAADLKVQDWRIADVSHHVEVKQYETDFGSIQPGAWDGRSSRYLFEVRLVRPLVPYVVKFTLPLLVIVMMAFSVFFLNTSDLSVQSAIVVTALLACVASHLSQANSLPDVGYLVRADLFFLLSYLLISLTLAEVIAESRLAKHDRHEAVHRLKRVCRVAFPLVFVSGMALLCLVR